jgi:hypothetical protein
VFHSEHNRLVQHTKDVVLATGDLAFLNEWLAEDVAALPTTPAEIAALAWDGERLFQAAKFTTEMQYQHLFFEEFARKIQPNIDFFVVPQGYDVTIDPSIVAEFAHTVYRFGHSMLTESIDRYDPSFNADHIGLIQGFLNPVEFAGSADEAAGAITRGMTRQVGAEIDEFVTGALRNNLLGLPLDLATINLARGRDTGVPSLNAARRDFYEATFNATELKPYESWTEFAGGLKNEASIINFIAAYGTHPLITGQTTLEGKRAASLAIIFGQDQILADGEVIAAPTDAVDLLNSTGAWANQNGITTTGLDNVDFWIGGLAEKISPFGGMLGSTFNFVFERQMEDLQNGDRFYYLQRLDGLHLFGEMEANSFASMIMRNTDATHLPSDVFSAPGLILEVDRTKQFNPGTGETAGADGILLDDPNTAADESADNLGNDPTGDGIPRSWSSATTRPRRARIPTTYATPAGITSCSAAPTAMTSSSPASATTPCMATPAVTRSKAARATTSSTAATATTSSRTSAATTTSRAATATTRSMVAAASTWSSAGRAATSSSWAPTRARKPSAAWATTSSSAARRPSGCSATRATTGSRSATSTARPATASTRSSPATRWSATTSSSATAASTSTSPKAATTS